MVNNSKFFQNRECQYFPCHKFKVDNKTEEKFNCLFCFCPLYHMDVCPGNPVWLENGVKDCSHCNYPHFHYDGVIECINKNNLSNIYNTEEK